MCASDPPKKRWNTVAVIGVGLIGGSVGLTLLRRGLADRVVGIGRRETSLQKARQCGAVTETTVDLRHGVQDADLIVVCTPVALIVDHVQQAAQACRTGAVITDAGSTKESVVTQLSAGRDGRAVFVGSHPLAGSEKKGPEYAQDDLFQGRVVVVTPVDRTPPEAVRLVVDFWRSLGASVIRMAPADHDRAVATTSHLPHVVSAALAASTPDELLPLVAGGWLDTTRVAAGDAGLWQQILRDNRHRILESMDSFAQVFDSFRVAISQDDAQTILELLEAGKQCRDAVGNRHPSDGGTT